MEDNLETRIAIQETNLQHVASKLEEISELFKEHIADEKALLNQWAKSISDLSTSSVVQTKILEQLTINIKELTENKKSLCDRQEISERKIAQWETSGKTIWTASGVLTMLIAGGWAVLTYFGIGHK